MAPDWLRFRFGIAGRAWRERKRFSPLTLIGRAERLERPGSCAHVRLSKIDD